MKSVTLQKLITSNYETKKLHPFISNYILDQRLS